MSISENTKSFLTQSFNAIEEQRQKSGYYKNLKLPEIKSGKEHQLLNNWC